MIQQGIELVCRRFNVIFDILREKGLNLEAEFRTEQGRFQKALTSIHRDLCNWELENVGEQTFSKAFEPLIDHIFMSKAKSQGLKKNTVPGMVRQA